MPQIIEKINFWKKKSFALNQLDLKLAPYLSFNHGFFVECGANNGIDQSNTLYFEKYQKWRGLLVEAVPELAQQCKENRPKCIVENFALVPFDYPKDYIEMQYCNLMSVVKGAMRSEKEEQDHIQRGSNVQKVEPYSLKAPTATLTSLLLKHDITNIDFFSLDVEGFELEVLKGLDFDRFAPDWIIVEARFRDEIESYLNPLYEIASIFTNLDLLFKHRNI